VEELLIIEHWRQLGVVFEAEVSGKDDWVWMYASLLGEGRMVVTNDEMRDHWLHLLEHRLFRRWKEGQLVHFEFVRNGDPTSWQIRLQPPPSWAHATQCSPNGVWHIASSDDDSWLCAQPLAPLPEDPPCRGAVRRVDAIRSNAEDELAIASGSLGAGDASDVELTGSRGIAATAAAPLEVNE
jgi:hypothetical protein